MWKKFAGAYEYQAYRILQILFFCIPVGKGIDKISIWAGSHHINSPFAFLILEQSEPHAVLGIGIMEMIIGIGIFFKPKFFAYLLMIWFSVYLLISIILGRFLDVGLRDFVLALAALAFARLSHKYAG